jgi:hypothetical protein
MTSSIGIIARHPTLDFSIGNLMVYYQIPSDSQAQITSKMMVNIGRPPENDGAEGPRIYFQHLCIWIVMVPDS